MNDSNDNKSEAILPNQSIVARPTQVVVARPRGAVTASPARAVTARPTQATTATPPKRAVYEERGWSLISTSGARQVYVGLYQVSYRRTGERRTCRGHIVLDPAQDSYNQVVPFLSNPPAEVHSHPKHLCVRHINGDLYRVFWTHPAKNLDEAILYVEQILDESINSH